MLLLLIIALLLKYGFLSDFYIVMDILYLFNKKSLKSTKNGVKTEMVTK